MKKPPSPDWDIGVSLSDELNVPTVIRPDRGRSRAKNEQGEKTKKPSDGVRKKSPPVRKAPARGRFVDEYARPSF